MVDRSKRAEKRYEDYKRSQEARIYNHPGPDARRTLMDKLQTLRMSSHERSEVMARIMTDLGSLPSHYLSDVVAYNEHNHLTEDTLAEEKRKAAIKEVEERLNEQHDCADRKLLELRTRLDGLAKEKEAREIVRSLPPPVDPNQMAMEEAVVVHGANAQRVTAVEVRIRLGSSVLAVHFTEPCSLSGFYANDHFRGVGSTQRWTDPGPREITPDHERPSSKTTRVR